MMVTTHVLAGALFGVGALFLAPEHAPLALVAGAAGGALPDLDLYAGHRRTLHFPVYGSVATAAAAAVAVLAPGTWTVGAAVLLGAATLHAVSDALGSGLELRPWEGNSERAVYDHFNGRWVAPRRWVRYDGAPEDLALGTALALPTLWGFGHLAPVRRAVLGILLLSAGYVVIRKPMARLAVYVVRRLPAPIADAMPERFASDLQQQ
jgi:hypothetical protein